jgi:hypothetical protein
MTQRRAFTPLEKRVGQGDDVAVNMQLREGDQVILDVDVLGQGTAALGLYHTGGALCEEVLAGRRCRTIELDVKAETDSPHLLFVSARETAVDVELTVLR